MLYKNKYLLKVSMECPVCVEKYTKRDRKRIDCIKCGNNACSDCCKKYILGSINEAHCMGCKNPWDRKFLVDNFTYKFVTEDYKEFLQNILYEREKANMTPAYQVLDAYKKADGIKLELVDLEKQEFEMNIKLNELENEHWRLKNKISQMKWNVSKLENGEIVELQEKKEYKFFGHCPRDDCKGIITEKIKCNVCEQKVCKSCKEAISNEPDALKLHACNLDTLETLKSIKSDSKNCPKCKVSIYKIEGCNQMFCTQCNIAFCWRTGEIYRGRNIHNPHYFQWLDESSAIENQINPCNITNYLQVLSNTSYSNNYNTTMLRESIYTFIDINGRIIYNLRDKMINEKKIVRLKVNYLLGYCDESKFKEKLQIEDIKVHRANEQLNIMESLVSGFCVIMKNEFDDNISKNIRIDSINKIECQFDKLIEFSETLQKEYHKKYKTKCYKLYWKNSISKRNPKYISIFNA